MSLLKKITFFTFLVLCCNWSFAQIGLESECDLSVNISDIKSIKINQSQFDLLINVDNYEDLVNGKSLDTYNHIEVMSTSEYEIKVSAASELLGKERSIPLDRVFIGASQGDIGRTSSEPIDFSNISLSMNQQSLIRSNNGDARRTFNVAYRISNLEDFINYPSDTYTTIITYSIVSD